MDELKKPGRGRPLKNPARGAMSGADRNWAYRRRLQDKQSQQLNEVYRLAHEWCCFLRDLEHRDPELAEFYHYNTLARDAAIRVLGAEEVDRIFASEPISVTAQRHKDARARERARNPVDEEDISERLRNDFSPGDENASPPLSLI